MFFFFLILVFKRDSSLAFHVYHFIVLNCNLNFFFFFPLVKFGPNPIKCAPWFKTRDRTESLPLKLQYVCVILSNLQVTDSQQQRRAGNGEQQGSSLGSLELQKWPACFVSGGIMVTDSLVFSRGLLSPIAKTPRVQSRGNKEGPVLISISQTSKRGTASMGFGVP